MIDAPHFGSAIHLSNVRFSWPKSTFGLSVRDWSVHSGETVLLLGASGSGKSTLLSLICGINAPQSGNISINGTDIGALTGTRRDRFRADTIGIGFQLFILLPYANGLDNILLPLKFSTQRRANFTDPKAEALRLAQSLGIGPDILRDGPASNLSVGQQQRVAVARALIGSPPILVADEPTSALDSVAQGEFLDLMFDQVRRTETTLVMVSHDERLADRFDRVEQLAEIIETSAMAAP